MVKYFSCFHYLIRQDNIVIMKDYKNTKNQLKHSNEQTNKKSSIWTLFLILRTCKKFLTPNVCQVSYCSHPVRRRKIINQLYEGELCRLLTDSDKPENKGNFAILLDTLNLWPFVFGDSCHTYLFKAYM